MVMTGVYPVYSNKLKVGVDGRESSDEKMVSIAEMECFSVAIDGSVEEWTPLDSEGWIKRLTTGKGLTISLARKRCVGDSGNDYVAAVAWKNGRECDSKFQWEFPDGAKLTFDCVIHVTTPGGGDSTAVAGLAFDVMSSGKPIYTPAVTPAA